MTTVIIGGILGGIVGALASSDTATHAAQRLTCRLTGHNWRDYGYIERQCPTHGTERATIEVCGRCDDREVHVHTIRTTPEE